jgi:hypothetical protein
MAGSSPNYYLLLFDLEYSNIVLIGTVYISTKFQPDRTSNIDVIWSPWEHTFASGLRGGTCRIHLWKARVHTTWTNDIGLSIITFSLSRTTVEVSHVAAGEHMVPGPFHSSWFDCLLQSRFMEWTLQCMQANFTHRLQFEGSFPPTPA